MEALHRAAAILLALPTARPAGEVGRAWSFNLSAASGLLAELCRHVLLQQQSTLVAAVHRDRGPALTFGLRGEAAGAAAWQSVSVLPRLAASLVALTGELEAQNVPANQRDSRLRDLHNISTSLRLPLYFVYGWQLQECSPQQLSCWLAAAAASLRLLPCFAVLSAQLRQPSCFSDLCLDMLTVVTAELPKRLSQLAPVLQRLGSLAAELPPEQAAAWDGLPAQLWALHTAVCRLVAAAPARLPGVQLTAHQWRSLHICLSSLLSLCCDAHMAQRSTTGLVQLMSEAPRQVGGRPCNCACLMRCCS